VRLRALAAAFLASSLALGAYSEPAPAQNLALEKRLVLGPSDLRIEQLTDGGYHLYVRAKPGMGSVLLTESTKDPASKNDSFAYRALEKNAFNGDETRVLDGKRLPSGGELHFLVDSSPENDAVFGKAFHIFIPWVVAWGYPWSRSGKVFIHDGTFVNIRTFEKSYADYSGAFVDNPYLIRVTQAQKAAAPSAAARNEAAPAAVAATAATTAANATATAPAAASAAIGPKADLYFPETLAAFGALAKASGGALRYASSDEDIASQIDALLARARGKSLDLVLCVDATDSMINGVDDLKSRLPALLAKRAADFPSFRLGIVSFKDYFEEYLYKRFDFTRDLGTFASNLESLQCGGGRDIPEAVYEGLYAALDEFPWAGEARLVVLVGDAPPHPLPRGSVGKAEVLEAASGEGVEMDAVAVPK
jgi:Mg-chelatase subunit ChlD